MSCLISLILPIYNVGPFLEECILSCIRQDLSSKEYEIILVLDGPTDESENIAKKYALAYPQVLISKQRNLGLSEARNNGLKNARGKYVWFIDSDDVIQENCLRHIVDSMDKHNLEALFINQNLINDLGYIFQPSIKLPNLDSITGLKFLPMQLQGHFHAWKYIFQRKFLQEHHASFFSGILYEDVEFIYKLMHQIKRIGCDSHIYYDYRIRQHSIMTSTNNYTLRLTSIDALLKTLKAHRKSIRDEQYLYVYDSRMIKMASIFIYYYKLCNMNDPMLMESVLSSIRQPQKFGIPWIKSFIMHKSLPLYQMILACSKKWDEIRSNQHKFGE